MEKNYYALAYYLFTNVDNPKLEIQLHKEFFKDLDVSCRIYISEDGINGQFSGYLQDAEAYMLWLKQRPVFSEIKFKIHHIQENVFPRKTVKYKKELVALGESASAADGCPHVSPDEWYRLLKENKTLILDVRNNYEWAIGHFENAVLPDIQTFREFPEYADNLAKQYDPESTPVMMYCTGGIRCELYSAVLMKRGFKTVYQLDGGVIGYGNTVGDKGWLGKLFVFDDRMAVPIDANNPNPDPISQCIFCNTGSDLYYNCANTDCNKLFLCCTDCIEPIKGCCSKECSEAPRIRAFDASKGNKPFRRKHLIDQPCSCSCNI